jgi:hypothetical protein
MKINHPAIKDFKSKREIDNVISNLRRLKKIMNRIDLTKCEDSELLLFGVFLSIETLEETLYKVLTIIENEIYKDKEVIKNE